MNKYSFDLAQTKLFRGINPKEIDGLLDCLRAGISRYPKGEIIIEEGSRVSEFGIILSGHGRTIKWDASDKVFIVTLLQKGSEIGVLFAASPRHDSSVSVQALDDVTVLFISFDRLMARCKNLCIKHNILLRNYIGVVAEKGLVLHERISCLLKHTLREKITAYLIAVSREQKSLTFTIPLNRNAMAEYLNTDRSALSRELSYMKRDGLIDYHRNSFKLLQHLTFSTPNQNK